MSFACPNTNIAQKTISLFRTGQQKCLLWKGREAVYTARRVPQCCKLPCGSNQLGSSDLYLLDRCSGGSHAAEHQHHIPVIGRGQRCQRMLLTENQKTDFLGKGHIMTQSGKAGARISEPQGSSDFMNTFFLLLRLFLLGCGFSPGVPILKVVMLSPEH